MWMRLGGSLLLTLSLVLLDACAGSASSGPTFDGKEYVVVDAGTLTIAAASLVGTGSLVFKAPLAQIASKNSYRLSFTLQDSGTLSLAANATATLTEAATVKFSRSGTTLTVVMIAAGTTNDVSASFAGVDASSNLVFQVDVHNDETPAHILIWDEATTSFTDTGARLNSEDSGLNAPGRGSATYWGLTLTNATVTGAALSGAKFVE